MRLRPVILDHGRRTVTLLGSAVLLTLLLAGGVVLMRDAEDRPMRTVKARGRAPNGTIVAVGDVLLGARNGSKPFEPAVLVRSRDGGKRWAEESPPGMPKAGRYLSLSQYDDVVVLAVPTEAEEPPLGTPYTHDAFVWTTTDGERWSGPLVLEDTAGVGAPLVGSGAGRLVTAATFGNEVVVFTSADRGKSWHRSGVSGLSLVPEEIANLQLVWTDLDGSLRALLGFHGTINPAHEWRSALLASSDGTTWAVRDLCPTTPLPPTGHCNRPLRARGLLARGLETSRDSGATWVRAVLDGQFEDAHNFGSIAAVPGGGWLGTVNGYVYAGGGPLAWVVRSDDGVRWKPLLGPGADRCPPKPVDTDTPSNHASRPLRAGGRWYVSFSCRTRGSALYVADEDARTFRPVVRGTRVGEPFRRGGDVVVPVFDRKGKRRLVVARP